MAKKTIRGHVLSFTTTFEQADDLKRESKRYGLTLSEYLNQLTCTRRGQRITGNAEEQPVNG